MTLYLPLSEGSEAGPEADVDADVDAAKAGEGEGKLVLVVEDQEDVRNLVCAFLEDLGYRFETASNGRDGLEKIGQMGDQIAILLCDMIMPGDLNGVQLIAAARKTAPHIKTLLMSGNPALSSENLDDNSDTVGLLRKPFTMNDLARELDNCLTID